MDSSIINLPQLFEKLNNGVLRDFALSDHGDYGKTVIKSLEYLRNDFNVPPFDKFIQNLKTRTLTRDDIQRNPDSTHSILLEVGINWIDFKEALNKKFDLDNAKKTHQKWKRLRRLYVGRDTSMISNSSNQQLIINKLVHFVDNNGIDPFPKEEKFEVVGYNVCDDYIHSS